MIFGSISFIVGIMIDMEHSITEAMELWKRVFDWTGDPFVEQCNYTDLCCFFCSNESPNHAPGCVWPKAEKLVKADEKGLVK